MDLTEREKPARRLPRQECPVCGKVVVVHGAVLRSHNFGGEYCPGSYSATLSPASPPMTEREKVLDGGFTRRDIARALQQGGMRCLCHVENWPPQPETGHGWCCPVHDAARDFTSAALATLTQENGK